MAETPRFAQLTVLLFLGSALFVVCCAIAAIVATIAKMRKFAKLAAMSAALTPVLYGTLLLGAGAATRNRTLPAGGWKYFCEMDCHIAYQVEGVQETVTLGPENSPVTARGKFIVVSVKTWFDENTIARFRGNAPLTPNPRAVHLMDDAGHWYTPIDGKLEALIKDSVPLSTPLRPGESYSTAFVFDVPREAVNPRLLINDSDPVTRILVDHENSPLHGKIFLSLQSRLSAATAVRK